MSGPLPWWGLATLIAATWTVLGAMVLLHRHLNRRWPIRQAQHLTRTANQEP